MDDPRLLGLQSGALVLQPTHAGLHPPPRYVAIMCESADLGARVCRPARLDLQPTHAGLHQRSGIQLLHVGLYTLGRRLADPLAWVYTLGTAAPLGAWAARACQHQVSAAWGLQLHPNFSRPKGVGLQLHYAPSNSIVHSEITHSNYCYSEKQCNS
jgi:hypothetical protein